MADYRDHYGEIQSTGASVVAVSVDAPDKSEVLRKRLSLPFPILCDTEHRVIKDWDIYNSAEKGGIAKPAVFIIDSSQVVRYASGDSVVRRIPAREIVCSLRSAATAGSVRRSVHVPLPSHWFTALRNLVRR